MAKLLALRRTKPLLAAAIGLFIAAAVYISVVVFQRQKALDQVSRYNIAWSASQAVSEYMRFGQRVSAYGSGLAHVTKEDVELRYDILVNRLHTFGEGEFRGFADANPSRKKVLDEFAQVIAELQPLVADIDRPGAIDRILTIWAPLEPKLIHLAADANAYGGQLVADDQNQLIRLHWLFSALAASLICCGLWLIALLISRNRLLARAHADLHVVTESLRRQEERLRLQNSLFDAALNNMPHGLCMFDAQHRLIVSNKRYAQIYGLPKDLPEAGSTLSEIVASITEAGTCSVRSGRRLLESQLSSATGRRPAALVQELSDGRSIAILQESMSDGGWVATYEDITERRRAEERIAYMARHDALTDLPNRLVFRDSVEQAMSRARRHGEDIAILYLDLDHFKSVNDTLGHAVGDALLRQVAQRLLATKRKEDAVARLGGDEFAVLQVGLKRAEEAVSLAERLVDVISQPFSLDIHEVLIGASIGIAIGPAHGGDADELMKNADMALYDAKSQGRSTFRFYEPEMDTRLQARRRLELDLRGAILRDEFQLLYQPLVNIQRNEITGFEALLRWKHPEHGIVSPSEFIPLAEEIGLIVPLGEWVLNEACREALNWPDSISLAVNLSSMQFRRGNLVETVSKALAASGLPARRLELEITESVLMQESEQTVESLNQLRALGIRLSMDDFGTGYSSLSYLRKFPMDKIKIDQAFIRGLSDRDSLAIVCTIVALGRSLGMTTTAEGLETEEQLSLVRAAGCIEAQGFLFSRPRPAEEISSLLRRGVTYAA